MKTTPLKIAFVGFRHGHIFSLYNKVTKHPALELVAACEEDAITAAALPENVKTTHTSYTEMLDTTPCDIIAIGDYYAKRGSLAIEALQRGKHVILDKPVCTSLDELATIRELVAEKNLRLGCMLDMREKACFLRARQFIAAGKLGKVTQIHFGGQHPLLLSSRPSWYFEKGKQGGTINDIGIHGIDMITFLTGDTIAKVHAAREWQAFYTRDDNFKDAAQIMLETANGCGVIGDVSYAAPNSQGYSNPLYWRFTIWGTAGVLDITSTADSVMAYLDGQSEGFAVEECTGQLPDCLDSFLADINGTPADLNTGSILKVSQSTLEIQKLSY